MLSFNRKFLVFPLMICLMLVTLCTFGFAGCSTDKITITFDANGGYFEAEGETVSTQTLEINKGDKLDVSLMPIPKRDDTNNKKYTFDGWDQNVSEMTFGENITIKAKWTEQVRKYTITFDANGGVYTHLGNPQTTVVGEYEYNNKITQPTNPTRASDSMYTYTFAGYDAEVSSKATQDVTYKAQWTQTPIMYTVTFNANGGKIDLGDSQVDSYQNNGLTFGSTIGLPGGYKCVAPTATEKYEYKFDGWYDAADGGNKVATVAGNTTVYAHWTKQIRRYDITFDAGTGTFKHGQKKITVNVKYGYGTNPEDKVEYPYTTTNAPTMEKTNTTVYTFSGFNIPAGYIVKGNVTFTAQYTESTRMYTVTFNAGEGYFGNPNEKVLTKVFQYNEQIVTPDVAPKRLSTVDKTFEFGGYAGLTDATVVTGDNMSFNAQWNESTRKYKVTFYAGEGAHFNINGMNQDSYVGEYEYDAIVSKPDIDPIKNPTQESTYTFTGYENLADTTKVTGDGMYFTAQYTSTTRIYTVTFDAGEGAFADGEKTVTQQVEYNKTPDVDSIGTPTRKGDTYADYAFSGWGTISCVSGDVTYTAKYDETVKVYKASFVREGSIDPFYTIPYSAVKYGSPSLTANDIAKLEEACETNGFSLKDRSGFAGTWDITLYNSSSTYTVERVYKFGDGTQANPYIINDVTSFAAMRDKMRAAYVNYDNCSDNDKKSECIASYSDVYYKIVADIDLSSFEGDISADWFIGHLDAQKSATENYSITGLDPDKFVRGDGALFGVLFNSDVSNLDILIGEKIASFGGHGYGYNKFTNVNIKTAPNVKSTFISSNDNNESVYMSCAMGDSVSFINCTNSANFVSEASYSGLFLGGYAWSDEAIFANCVFDGWVIASDSVGMLIGNGSHGDYVLSKKGATVTNCVNNGTITAMSFGNFVAPNIQGSWTAEKVAEYEANITGTGTYTQLAKINATLSTTDDLTLTSSDTLSAGKYVLTVVAYAKADSSATVRVNYSFTQNVDSSTNSIVFGSHYDFIDSDSYASLSTKLKINENDWKVFEGYTGIKYAFDNTNKLIVFDFTQYKNPSSKLVMTNNSKVYLSYYNTDNNLVGAAKYEISAYTRATASNSTEFVNAINDKKSLILVTQDFGIDTEDCISIDHNVVINFGGHKVTKTGSGFEVGNNVENSQLHLCNGTLKTSGISVFVKNGGKACLTNINVMSTDGLATVIASSSKIVLNNGVSVTNTNDNKTVAVVHVQYNSELTMNAGSTICYTGKYASTNVVQVISSNVNMLANSSIDAGVAYGMAVFETSIVNVYGNITSDSFAICTNGEEENKGVSIYVFDGANITSNDECAIFMSNGNDLNITGGTITGATALYIKSGNVTITGGTFVATKDKNNNNSFNHKDSGCEATGDIIIVEACGYPADNPVVSISNATLSNDKGNGAIGIRYIKYNNNEAQITVSDELNSSLQTEEVSAE